MLRLLYIIPLQTVPSNFCNPGNSTYGLSEHKKSATSLLLQHLLLPFFLSQFLNGLKSQSCALPSRETCLMGTDKRQILFSVSLTLLRQTAWVIELKASDTVGSKDKSHLGAAQKSGGQRLARSWSLVHFVPLQHSCFQTYESNLAKIFTHQYFCYITTTNYTIKVC